ncbi:MAG: sensor histidine kinase [Terriglobia bacterium]
MGITVALRSAPFSAPLNVDEVQHRERVLGVTRTSAALFSLLVLHFEPSLAGTHTLTTDLLLICYLLHSTFTLLFLRDGHELRPGFLLWLHASDILWPALIALLTGGPNSPFSALFAVALVGAAYRWGFRETLGTALASTLILLSETVFILSEWGSPFDLLRGHFHFSAFIFELAAILLLGSLLGHLTERENRIRGESLAIRQIIQKADLDAHFTLAVEEILRSILRLLDADRVVLAVNNALKPGGYTWTGSRMAQGPDAFHSGELGPREAERYFFPMPGKSWHLQKSPRGEACQVLIHDAEGRRLEKVACSLPGNLFSDRAFHTLLGAAFTLGKEWKGRIFLFDSRHASRPSADLHFIEELVAQVAPALHSLYLRKQSQVRARAIERARVARDLHDGVIQSLIALEMQVEVLRRQTLGVSTEAAEKLEGVRQLLRNEVINLRELMQQLKLDDVAPQQLLLRVEEMVEKFRRETGVSADFSSDVDGVAFSPRVSREIAQIVHEALTNVRKHSGAQHVQVHLTSDLICSKLVIEDDGKGFEFSGRLTQPHLDTARKGPQIIKERVRSIYGELVIESEPGHGSRLEIRFAPIAYGMPH